MGGKVQGKLQTFEQFKLANTIQVGTKNLEGRMKVRKVEEKPLRKVTVKISASHVVVEASLCFPYFLFIILLMDIICFSHSL